LFQNTQTEKKSPPHLPYKRRSHLGLYLGYPPKQAFHGEVIMMLDQVKNLSHQMRLFGIHQACDRRAAEALAQQLHPLEFLRLVLEEELLSRKDRTAKALTTKARFRFRADLEDLDLAFHKDLTKAKIKELSELSFLHNLENLLILGKTGLGKTHLAIALGKRLCQEGHPTQFLPVNFLFEEIQAAKAAGRYLNYVRSLIKAKVLILDDLGLRNYTHEEATSLICVFRTKPATVPGQTSHPRFVGLG